MSGQTVQTQIRLLLEVLSDQGLHWLQFRLHLWTYYSTIKPPCSNFRVTGVRNFRIFTVLACVSGALCFWKLSHLMRLWRFSSSINSFFKRACAAIHWGMMSDFWSDPSSTSILHVCEQRRLWQNARMPSLAWAFAVRLCDKYHKLLSWLKIAFIKPDTIMIKQKKQNKKKTNNNCKWGWPDFLHSCSKCQMSQYLGC